MLESKQLIWVEFDCSKRRTIHVPNSKSLFFEFYFSENKYLAFSAKISVFL